MCSITHSRITFSTCLICLLGLLVSELVTVPHHHSIFSSTCLFAHECGFFLFHQLYTWPKSAACGIRVLPLWVVAKYISPSLIITRKVFIFALSILGNFLYDVLQNGRSLPRVGMYCIRTLPRGGMYWEIHPLRPERFPKGPVLFPDKRGRWYQTVFHQVLAEIPLVSY